MFLNLSPLLDLQMFATPIDVWLLITNSSQDLSCGRPTLLLSRGFHFRTLPGSAAGQLTANLSY